MKNPSYVVGVDVGGTFTDIFVLDEAAGTVADAFERKPNRRRALRRVMEGARRAQGRLGAGWSAATDTGLTGP